MRMRSAVIGLTLLLGCGGGSADRKLQALSAATVQLSLPSEPEASGFAVTFENAQPNKGCEAISPSITANVNGNTLTLSDDGKQQSNLFVPWGCAPIRFFSSSTASELGLDGETSTLLFDDGESTWTISGQKLVARRELVPTSWDGGVDVGATLSFALSDPMEARPDAGVLAAFDLPAANGAPAMNLIVPLEVQEGGVKLVVPSTLGSTVRTGTLRVTLVTSARLTECTGPSACAAQVSYFFSEPVSVRP